MSRPRRSNLAWISRREAGATGLELRLRSEWRLASRLLAGLVTDRQTADWRLLQPHCSTTAPSRLEYTSRSLPDPSWTHALRSDWPSPHAYACAPSHFHSRNEQRTQLTVPGLRPFPLPPVSTLTLHKTLLFFLFFYTFTTCHRRPAYLEAAKVYIVHPRHSGDLIAATLIKLFRLQIPDPDCRILFPRLAQMQR